MMTLTEAIHNLQLQLDGNPNLHDTKLRQSMHLAIKTMEWRQRMESTSGTFKFRPLPGQAPELLDTPA